METILFRKPFSQGEFIVTDGHPACDIREVHQVHSNKVVEVNEAKNMHQIKADGIVAKSNSQETLTIKTADCVPILVLGQNGHALLHAGWKGVQSNIMLDQKIKNINPTLFFLGPAIQSCCYEVGEEFKEYFPNSTIARHHKLYCSLQKEIIKRIHLEFSDIEILDSKVCTHCEKTYNSYRRDKTKRRNYNLFIPKRK